MKNRPTQTLYASLSFAFILMMGVGHLTAQVPSLLEYDGYLIENKKPANGVRAMEVRVHDAAVKGKLLYSEKIGNVSVAGGEFYFQYGSKGIATALQGTSHWLEIVVNGKAQSPRERLVAVPFAIRSADAQKSDADLRKVIDAFSRVVGAFGGNQSSLLTNPSGSVEKLEKNVKDLLGVLSKSRVMSLSGNLSFGSLGLASGSVGQPKYFNIHNQGFDNLVVSSINCPPGYSFQWVEFGGAYEDQEQVDVNFDGSIPPNTSKVVKVEFKPQKLGKNTGNITVVSNATSGVFSIPCSGTGVSGITGTRIINVTGDQDYSAYWQTTIYKNLTIANTGSDPLTVSNIRFDPEDGLFSLNWSGGVIAPNSSKNVTVSWTPDNYSNNDGPFQIIVDSNATTGTPILEITTSWWD